MKRTTPSVVAFIGGTFLISWSAWGLLGLVEQDPGLNIGGVFWVIGGLGPAIAALGTVHQFIEGETPRSLLARLANYRVGWRWYLVALLLPGLVITVGVAVDRVVWGTPLPTPDVTFVLVLIALIVASSIIGGGLEEIGWRGFLLPRLQSDFTALTASLLVGAVWMVWHAPLFILPGTVQTDLPVIPYIVQGVALAVLFAWAYNSSRGSVLLLVLFHGSFNAWLSGLWLIRDAVTTETVWVMAGVVCLIAIVIVLRVGRADLAGVSRQTI